jgi:hypothetical protein
VQVDKDAQAVVCDELLEDTSTEELKENLPEHQPRLDNSTIIDSGLA